MSTIHFIGGEKGGVGKSVVARLLAQYCIDRSLPFVAVDADVSHGALVRYYAEYATPVDLEKFESADEIIGLATAEDRRVIVDLPAQSERALSKWMEESGVLDLARASGVNVVFWHVMGDGKESITTLERLFARHGSNASYFVVKNLGRGKDFSLFEQSTARSTGDALGAKVIHLPELYGPAMQKIDRFDASFWAAVNNPALGDGAFTRMDRQRIHVWIQESFKQVASLGDSF